MYLNLTISIHRYTEGDFHQLKMLHIERPKQINKQRSLGAPIMDNMMKDQPYPPTAPLKLDDRPKHIQGISRTVHNSDGLKRPILSEGLSHEKTDNFPENPMMDGESPSPPCTKPHRTEVSVEVHRVPSSGSGSSSKGEPTPVRTVSPPKILQPDFIPSNKKRHSQSLEMVSPTDRLTVRYTRRAKSYEGELPVHRSSEYDSFPLERNYERTFKTTFDRERERDIEREKDRERGRNKERARDREYSIPVERDYDRQEITQFIRGPFYNADYEVISEGGTELRSKVRYNDTGSFEEVNEDHVQFIGEIDIDVAMDSSDDTETLNGASKYRELWSLRATLEEDEDFSDTIRMEDYSSPDDQSPEEREISASVTTSFESNTEPVDVVSGSRGRKASMHGSPVKLASANLLHPNYESRRQTYRNILSKRLKHIEAPASTDNSFDSIETMDTDGEVSDTSRHEVTTTSFESTTDNTDSTGENNTHRLQMMKGDSGYKSLETQQTLPPNTPPRERSDKKQIQFHLDPDQGVSADLTPSPEDPAQYRQSPSGASTESPSRSGSQKKTTFERRNGKTASKKRREYSRERQVGLETDSKSDQFSGDSFDEGQTPGKFSLFTRFFKSYHEKRAPVARDYSIDEKTNAIYHEFMRYDPIFDPKHYMAIRRPHLYGRHRLHRKHTDTLVDYDVRRRDKLHPEMRSASLGSDSSTSSVRRLSPQDSIEEEYIKGRDPGGQPKGRTWEPYRQPVNMPGPLRKESTTIHEIPIIKLPEEEATEA